MLGSPAGCGCRRSGRCSTTPRTGMSWRPPVGAGAWYVVPSNLRDFPTASRPPGVKVVRPDTFAIAMLHRDPDGVLEGLSRKVARHRHPPHTLAGSDSLRRFAGELAETLK